MLESNIDAFKYLITKNFREADVFANRGEEDDAEIALLLHLTNLDRLITFGYGEIDRGARFLDEPKPSTKDRCDAVVTDILSEGCSVDAITAARLSGLMRLSGYVKHAVHPKVAHAETSLTGARETTQAVYRHFFGEDIPWCTTLQDPRNLGPVVFEISMDEAEDRLWRGILERLTPLLSPNELRVLLRLGLPIVTGAVHSASIRSIGNQAGYDALGRSRLDEIVAEFSEATDAERDLLIADLSLRVQADLKSIIATESDAVMLLSPDIRLNRSATVAVAFLALDMRFADWT